jgi:PAS domain S-box-containing protein
MHAGRLLFLFDRCPVRIDDAPPEVLSLYVLDITHKKNAERELRESEDRFRLLTERIENVFWISDPKLTRMVYVSPAYERIWKQSRASLYENPPSFLEVVHEEDRARVAANLRANQMERQQPFEIEYSIRWPNGEIRWIRDRGYPVYEPTGAFSYMVGIADDLTERKRVEEALKMREEIFSSIVGQAMVSIALVDGRSGGFVEFNTAAHEGRPHRGDRPEAPGCLPGADQ